MEPWCVFGDGKVRMAWTVDVFPKRKFWTRLSFPLYLTYPDVKSIPIDQRIRRPYFP
jgi:hypothetical protein